MLPANSITNRHASVNPIVPPLANRKVQFSVLISVYQNDDPVFFDEALRSVTVAQTYGPDEVVLVVDGPIGDRLEAVVRTWRDQRKYKFHVIRSAQNIGLSRALNLGLNRCRYPYVARMDSDDISAPDRFQKQIKFLSDHPEVDLLGAWYRQFDCKMENYLTDRKVPREMPELVRYARTRTPFNHVTGVFKRDALLSIGGYPKIDGYSEDWWVALRLIQQGKVLLNLPEYLVDVRGDGDFIGRRGGWQYIKHEVRNLRAMRAEELISTADLIKNLLLRIPVRLLPVRFRAMLYQAIRRV